MRTVSDVMTPRPVVVHEHTSLPECAQLFARHGHRHLPVVGPGEALVGVVTDLAVFARGALTAPSGDVWLYYDGNDTTIDAGDLAAPAEMASASTRLLPVLSRMATGLRDAVVIVDDHRRPLGILTEHDAIRLASETLPHGLLEDARTSSRSLTVPRDTPALEVLQLMAHHRLRHVLVLDEQGRADAVISHRDVASAVDGHRCRAVAGQIAGRDPLRFVRPGVPLREVAALFVSERIGCLPVLDDEDHPLRVVTRTDVVAALAAFVEEELLEPA